MQNSAENVSPSTWPHNNIGNITT